MSSTPSKLLELPPELINDIFSLSNADREDLHQHPARLLKDILKAEPALRKTCQKIRSETLPVFFAGLTPFIDSVTAVGDCGEALWADGLQTLQSIGFLFPCFEKRNTPVMAAHNAVIFIRKCRPQGFKVVLAHGKLFRKRREPDPHYWGRDSRCCDKRGRCEHFGMQPMVPYFATAPEITAGQGQICAEHTYIMIIQMQVFRAVMRWTGEQFTKGNVMEVCEIVQDAIEVYRGNRDESRAQA